MDDDLLLARPDGRPSWHPRRWRALAWWWRWVDERSTTWTRLAVLVVVGGLAWFPFVLGAFVAGVVATDCLLGCGDDPRPFLGALLAVPPAVLAAGVVAMVPWVAGRPELCRRTFAWSLVGVPAILVVLAVVA